MTTIKKTIHELENEYFAMDSISSSQLKDLISSPAIYYAKYIEKTMPSFDSYATNLGSKIHAYLLQPELVDISYQSFSIAPCLPTHSFESIMKEAKSRWKTIEVENGNTEMIYIEEPKSDDAKKKMLDALTDYYEKEIILPGEITKIIRYVNELNTNPITREVLNSLVKKEYVLLDTTDDINMKCKLDGLTDDGWVIDYKSCEHPINDELACYSIRKYGYHISAALYCYIAKRNGLDIKGFKWIFQNKGSGQCGVMECPVELLELGMRKVKLGLEILARCRVTNVWADYINPETGATNYDSEIDLSRAAAKVFGLNIEQENFNL